MPSIAGAVILPELKKTLLFKNRDLSSKDHKDELFYDVDCFGVRGVDAVTKTVEGLAIGVNRNGLAVANTHVRNTPNPSYHLLTEQILMFAKNAEDGLALVVDALKKDRKYQWGNIVLADDDSMLVIELAGSEHSIEWSERKVIRSSHHIMLDTEHKLRAEETKTGFTTYQDSETRFYRGYDKIKDIKTISDVFGLLKDHGEVQGQGSICRHPSSLRQVSTIMSYVVEVDYSTDVTRPKVVFHVAHGNPCEAQYKAIPLIFPADEEIMKRANEIYFS